MDFTALVNKTWRENILFSVLLELTYRCNLNCFFCYNDVRLQGRALEREQYFGLLEDLERMQVFSLVLTGGEPLAHPDFFAIGKKARELGFMVRLKSNGHALSGALARRIRDEVDPFLIEVSLHGARAETHDRQTRVVGSFETLTRNLEQARENGLRIKINATLTRWNERETEAMMDLAAGLGMPIHIDPIVTPRDDGDTAPLAISPSAEGVRELLRLQQERGAAAARAAGSGDAAEAEITVGRQADDLMPRSDSTKHCGAGSAGVAIDPFGNVYPCVQWRRAVGNLHHQRIHDIWRGSSGLTRIRRLTEDVKAEIDALGDWGSQLNFCPGSAEQETGSPLGVYDSARQRADAAAELAGLEPETTSGPPAAGLAGSNRRPGALLPVVP